jgi:signal transduction histidine kinase
VAIDNVVENAILASRSGGEVMLSAGQGSEDELRITVRDDGAGMTPEVARRAPEIGFSTRDADGTGMTVAKFIAYHHSGGFQVETHPGQGTTVTILLPLSVQ